MAMKYTRVEDWHESEGGFGQLGSMGGHACRLLREVVELCIACGASADDIYNAVHWEHRKAIERDEYGGEIGNIGEEYADVALLLDVFRHYARINHSKVYFDKLAVLQQRKWEVDENGVLWRPGTRR